MLAACFQHKRWVHVQPWDFWAKVRWRLPWQWHETLSGSVGQATWKKRVPTLFQPDLWNDGGCTDVGRYAWYYCHKKMFCLFSVVQCSICCSLFYSFINPNFSQPSDTSRGIGKPEPCPSMVSHVAWRNLCLWETGASQASWHKLKPELNQYIL